MSSISPSSWASPSAESAGTWNSGSATVSYGAGGSLTMSRYISSASALIWVAIDSAMACGPLGICVANFSFRVILSAITRL